MFIELSRRGYYDNAKCRRIIEKEARQVLAIKGIVCNLQAFYQNLDIPTDAIEKLCDANTCFVRSNSYLPFPNRRWKLGPEKTSTYYWMQEKRWAKLKVAPSAFSMEIQVEKALDAIYVCCFQKHSIEEEDERLLTAMFSDVFPPVQRQQIQHIVKNKAKNAPTGVMDFMFQRPSRIKRCGTANEIP